MVAVAPLEAREARGLPFLQAAEECLIRLIKPGEHILQDLGVDGRIVGECRFQVGQLALLLIAGERDATLRIHELVLL